MDDSSGWNQILLELWSVQVRDAVVARIERAAVGRHGWLARVFADPDGTREALTETVHAVVLAAIRDETGADLDALGSQAAWECYEQVWRELERRWVDGGPLAIVPLGDELVVIEELGQLPEEVAVAAGAEVDERGVHPLWLRGRLRVDEQGLRAHLDHVERAGVQGSGSTTAIVRRILARLT